MRPPLKELGPTRNDLSYAARTTQAAIIVDSRVLAAKYVPGRIPPLAPAYAMPTCRALIPLLTCLIAAPAAAQTPVAQQLQGDAAYAVYFGDGMRHHVEGRHVDAIEHLSRAFAMRPQVQTLRMIIRSYDAIGHCAAAAQQQLVHRELFPAAGEPPALARCAQTATLKLECGSSDAELVIDQRILTTCNASVLLPPGVHIIEGNGFSLVERVELAAREVRAISLPIDAARSNTAKSSDERVPMLATSSERFRVYLSPDGLYQIWVRLDERAPDLLSPYGPEIRFSCRKGPNGQKICEQSPAKKK